MRQLALAALPLAILATACGSSRHDTKPAPTTQPTRTASAAPATPAVPALSPQQFHRAVQSNPNYVILDVRTPDEFSQGHLPNARLMNVQSPDFDAQLASLDPTKTYLTYCRTGRRSATACQKLTAKGLNCQHLEGGITAWRAANLPVEQP